MSVSRFIVVDNDTATANGMTRALSSFGYAFPVTHLREVGSRWPADCAIFVSDYDGQLAEAIEYIRGQGIFYPLVPYRHSPAPHRVVEAIRCGAMSYLDWPCSEQKLDSVLATMGESCEILFREKGAREQAFALLRTLTPKETQVLGEIATGASSKEISRTLGISPRTVEVHRSSILSKLKVRNAIAAVRMALELRLPEVPSAYR